MAGLLLRYHCTCYLGLGSSWLQLDPLVPLLGEDEY